MLNGARYQSTCSPAATATGRSAGLGSAASWMAGERGPMMKLVVQCSCWIFNSKFPNSQMESRTWNMMELVVQCSCWILYSKFPNSKTEQNSDHDGTGHLGFLQDFYFKLPKLKDHFPRPSHRFSHTCLKFCIFL